MNWDTALDGYWLARRRDLSPHTIRDYELTFRRFREFIGGGEVAIKAIKRTHVERFLNHLRDDLGLSAKTVGNHWIALSSFWSWAADELGAPQVLRTVRRPVAKQRIVQPYSQEEVQRLLDACVSMRAWSRRRHAHVAGARPTAARDQALILVLLDTGIRAAELSALRVRDYDRKQGRLTILCGKGGKQREVFLGQSAQRVLWRYLAERGEMAPAAPLFCTSVGGEFDRLASGNLLRRLGGRAGVSEVGAHRFRHTFAINFLRNGGHLLALQDILGHSTLAMVRRYARLAEVDIAAAQRGASPADKWRL